MTARRKKEAWARVCAKVNSVGKGATRTTDDIMKKWRDMKSAVLKEQTFQTKTGGGGPMKETPFKELILFILGDRSEVVAGIDVTGTDSFLAGSKLETLLQNEEEGNSTGIVYCTASTSNMGDPSISQLFTMTQRSLCMPTSCIITPTSSETSGVDVDRQQEELLSTVPDGVSEHITGSKSKRKKRRHPMLNTGDELFNNWLSSQMETHEVKRDFMRSQMELNKSEMERNKSDMERNKSDMERNKSDMERNKSDMERNKSQMERNKSQMEMSKSQMELNNSLKKSQIELNEVLKQESLLRMQDLQTHNK